MARAGARGVLPLHRGDDMMLYQVKGKDRRGEFTAGLVVEDGLVWKAAPKLSWMLRCTIEDVIELCRKRGWDIRRVSDE